VDFYSELRRLLKQIPRGRVTTLSALAEALGDRSVIVSLPGSLEKILSDCHAAARVVKADGSFIFTHSQQMLAEEGVVVEGMRVGNPAGVFFSDFETLRPLRALRHSQRLRSRQVILRDGVRKPKTLAGVDVSYDDDDAYAAAVVINASTLEILEQQVVHVRIDFPYVPGYLAFREMPALLAALDSLRLKPDVLFVDGHGILHPARCGVASFVGLELGMPTIGVGKSYLVGEVTSGKMEVGDAAPVKLDGRVAGYALRSSESKQPIYISPGNLITPMTALKIVQMACSYRIPEPIRQADALASNEKMKNKKIAENAPVSQD